MISKSVSNFRFWTLRCMHSFISECVCVCFTFTCHTRMSAIPVSEVRVIRSPYKVEHTIFVKDNTTLLRYGYSLHVIVS